MTEGEPTHELRVITIIISNNFTVFSLPYRQTTHPGFPDQQEGAQQDTVECITDSTNTQHTHTSTHFHIYTSYNRVCIASHEPSTNRTRPRVLSAYILFTLASRQRQRQRLFGRYDGCNMGTLSSSLCRLHMHTQHALARGCCKTTNAADDKLVYKQRCARGNGRRLVPLTQLNGRRRCHKSSLAGIRHVV